MDKVAVIGLGSIATRHRSNLKAIYPNCLTYVMSSSGRVPTEYIDNCDHIVNSLEEIIAKQPVMAIVASPAPFHAKHAIPLVEAGIPVLIEKPITATHEELSRLIDAIDNHSTPVAIGYCLRYLPSMMKVKDLLEKEALGHLYNADINVGQFLPDWRPNKDYRDSVSANRELGGGVLLELSHEFDYAHWILGNLNVEYAILRSSKELNLAVEDIADVVLTNQQGTVCNIHLDFLQRVPQRTCSIIGSKGRIDWNLIENSVELSNVDGSHTVYSDPQWDKNQMYLSMINDFDSMIKGEHHQCVNVDDAAKVIKTIDSIKKQANWNC
jgi:hypothetical protein